MSRIDQVNELLKYELARLVEEHVNINGGLVTITFVDCSPDLKYAKIGISVLPEGLFGTALQELKKNNSFFSKHLRKKTRLRQVPHISWVIDDTEVKAAEIDEILKGIR